MRDIYAGVGSRRSEGWGRRKFLQTLPVLTAGLMSERLFAADAVSGAEMDVSGGTQVDAERMRALAEWTMARMSSPHPVPYAAQIFDTESGVSLMRAANAVFTESDPSAHGEIATIRLACRKLGSPSLRGYTLYTTCEPCPMCMACCLWAGLGSVVYGATIEDAARYGHQIMIPAAEVARRTDMVCRVVGPVERARCLALFTNETMQAEFKRWKEARR